MENERRFRGDSYPKGMCAFPFNLVGQGFFPGGDGLWRDEGELASTSTGALPIGGSVFLGNDFGTLSTYSRLRSKGYENPPTWKNLKQRIRRAKIPERESFFTNAVMGLRSEVSDKALHKRFWNTNPEFADFCREFLTFQIETVQPRLIVVMGPSARSTTLSLLGGSNDNGAAMLPRTIGCHAAMIHFTSHPYGDFNFREERKTADALRLRSAWDKSLSLQM
jgi:hypothetical protein